LTGGEPPSLGEVVVVVAWRWVPSPE